MSHPPQTFATGTPGYFVKLWARPATVVQTIILLFFIAGTHGWLTALPRATTTDYASFYAAGALANQGMPAAAYDPARHLEAEERATSPGIDYQYFFNPPTFLLLCAPLARLPYLPSFVLFEALSLGLWLTLGTRVAGGGRVATWALMAVPSAFWTLGLGQNSFVSASLMAAGTLLLSRRPAAAGIAFGVLCFKPHLGLLIPVALLVGRQYRAFAAATVTVAASVALSAWIFGPETWRAFFRMALNSRATIESGRVLFAGHVDPSGAARLLGLSASVGWAIQAAASLAAATVVALIWRRPAPGPVAYAALASATLIAAPYALFYDLVIASLAAAWLVRQGRQTGFLAGERTALAWLLLADALCYPVALTTRLPLGALVAPALLALCVRRRIPAGIELTHPSDAKSKIGGDVPSPPNPPSFMRRGSIEGAEFIIP